MAYVFAHGTGTEADPYLVETAEDLDGVRDYLDAHFKQVADIDLSGYENWEPIGTYIYGQNLHFNGTYDGNGHTISNLIIKREKYTGLFGYTYNAIIKNLGVVDVNVSGANYVGGLVGYYISTTITNSYSTGNVSGSYDGVGGLAGYATTYSAITNSYSTGNVSGANYVGGLVGYNRQCAITNSYSMGNVSGMNNTGGLAGYIKYSTITSSYYDTETSGQSDTGKGTPKTTAEMKTQETFADWDFTDVWGIDPAKNDGYPYLLWQYPDPPPEPFQPWTPPKLEPSWWEGFKLPFNVLELDEDAPIAIQRNFKEIEHYINFLGRTSGEIKDNLELLAAAPAPMSEEEMPDPEPEVPPTDSYFAGYLLGKEGQMGSIDAAIKTDSLGGINEVWIARVIDKQGIVEIYDSDAPEHIFRTVAREFNLPLVNLGADVVDVAIEFDGTYDQYNIFVSETEPHIFWVERTANEDIIYTLKWGGVDPAPVPTELARANLGYLGSGITVGLDPNITV